MAFERRYAGTKMERRGQRGPNDAVGSSYASILGANLVEMWHSQLGIATVSGNVDTWTGQIRGIVLPAPDAAHRPPYAADGSNFQGKSIPQMTVTGSLALRQLTAISPPLYASGTRPWTGLFGRMRSYPGAAQTVMVGALDNPITTLLHGIQSFPAPSVSSAFGGSGALINDNSTVVRLVGAGLDSSGVNTVSVNGTTIGTNGSGLTLGGAVQTLTLGSNTVGNFVADLSACILFCCNAYPSAAQLTALVAKLQAEFGPF